MKVGAVKHLGRRKPLAGHKSQPGSFKSLLPWKMSAAFIDAHAELLGPDAGLAAEHHPTYSPPRHPLTSKKTQLGKGALFGANMADVWKEPDALAERSIALLNCARSVHILGDRQGGIAGGSQDPRWQACGTMSQWWVHKRRWVVLWLLPTPGHECN